jgi:hypothetical protein
MPTASPKEVDMHIVTHAEASELEHQAARGRALRAQRHGAVLRTHNSDDEGVRAMTAHSVLLPEDRARLQRSHERARKAHEAALRTSVAPSDEIQAMTTPSLVEHFQARGK